MALLRIDPGIVIWTWITFILVLIILGASTWKMILHGLNARADKIQEDLANAEKTREDAKKSLVAYRNQIDNAKQEASAIIENARVEATRLRDKIISEAQEQIEINKVKLLAEIERSEEEAMNNVRKQAVDIAVVMAETILKRNVNESDNDALIEEFIKTSDKEGSTIGEQK